MHSSGVALAQPSHTYSTALGEVATADSMGGDSVLKDPVENVSMQLEQIVQVEETQSIVEGSNKPSGLATVDPYAGVEGLNEPSGLATIDPNARDGASVSGPSLLQPGITSFDQSSDLDTLRSNAEESISASAADSSQDAANTALSTDQFKSAKEAYEAMLSGTQDATDQESSIDALSQASQSLAGGLSEAKSAVVNAFTRVQESVQSSVDSASIGLKSAYDNINGSIISSFKHVAGLDGNAKTVSEPTAVKNVALQENLINILTSPFQLGTPVNNALKEVVSAVENITGKVLVGASELVVDGYTNTKEVLPVNAQVYLSGIEKKLIEVSGPIQTVLRQVVLQGKLSDVFGSK